jgi:uncharacterized coiled-coil protein SlyX
LEEKMTEFQQKLMDLHKKVTGRHKMLMEQLQEKMTYLSNSHVFNTW